VECGRRNVECGRRNVDVERGMLSEGDGLGDVGGIYPTLLIDSMPIAEGTFDTPEIHVSLHRAPSATALDQVVRHRPTSIRTDEDNICLISLSEESTIPDLKETGRIVAHQFDKTLEGQHTLINEFEHRDE
jgi:hypothetical protein